MKELIDVKKSRFRDASWFNKIDKLETPIIIGGAGGIGSWLTLFLGRMLTNTTTIFLYDFDTVEEVNMAGQLYSKYDIGNSKVSAIKNIVNNFSGFINIATQNAKYDSNSLASLIMFSAFDNMKARSDMFQNWKKEAINDPDNAIFIDGRLLAEQLQVFYVTMKNADEYENKYLFLDAEVEDTNCSYKQTTHFAATIAAKMVQGFTNWIAGDTTELPFYYEEIGGLFYNEIR